MDRLGPRELRRVEAAKRKVPLPASAASPSVMSGGVTRRFSNRPSNVNLADRAAWNSYTQRMDHQNRNAATPQRERNGGRYGRT